MIILQATTIPTPRFARLPTLPLACWSFLVATVSNPVQSFVILPFIVLAFLGLFLLQSLFSPTAHLASISVTLCSL